MDSRQACGRVRKRGSSESEAVDGRTREVLCDLGVMAVDHWVGQRVVLLMVGLCFWFGKGWLCFVTIGEGR